MPIPPIGSIGSIGSLTPALSSVGNTMPAAGTGSDFGKLVTDALNNLSQTEKTTNDLVTKAATGQDVDIHDVMIATQTENLTFQTALQVRNKLVEAYQEVFRMQM